jgi:hypothetical protein
MKKLISAALLLVASFMSAQATPVPKERPKKPVMVFDMSWGGAHQVTTFFDDGTCSSPEFGKGKWEANLSEGLIWFSEANDSTHWAMHLDPTFTSGQGFRVLEDGYGQEVRVDVNKPEPE